jgi:hypothetical protein
MAVGSMPGTAWVERTKVALLTLAFLGIAVGTAGSLFVIAYWIGTAAR